MLKARFHALSVGAAAMPRSFWRRARMFTAHAAAKARALHHRAGAAVHAGGRTIARAVAAIRSEHLRERLWAVGTFAGLALLLAASFDFLLGGGPNWNPGAEAAPYRADAYVRLSALPEIPYAPPPVNVLAAPEEQAKVTPVGYHAPAGILLGGPLPGDEGEAPTATVYAHDGPAPFGEFEAAEEPSMPSAPF